MKMLMEIDPLPIRGSLVMISPSRREVSPAEQLRQSPRLLPPRGGGVSSQKLAYGFSSDERLHIAEDGHRRPARGPMRQGARPGVGRAPTLVDGGWPPSGIFFAQYFLLIPKMSFVEFQDFWSQNRSLIFAPFQPRIPVVGILPLHVNLVK